MRMDINEARLRWDVSQGKGQRYEEYWKNRRTSLIPPTLLKLSPSVWLEIGAGSGFFFSELSRAYPHVTFIALERCRERGKRLVRKAQKLNLSNFHGIRGNAIPTLIDGIPDQSLDRIYILYPCPWARSSQRRNRWYLHPMMKHLVRALKIGGSLIWASDQKFYIDEAKFISEEFYPLVTVSHGNLQPNAENELAQFPQGRTKFEQSFWSQGLPCYELVSRRMQ